LFTKKEKKMHLIFLIITLLYTGFIGGFAYGKVKNEKTQKENQESKPAKTSFRSPLRRYE